jgi:hypothetical protein
MRMLGSLAAVDRHGTLAGARLDHPELDPVVGPGADEAVHELIGNTVRFNREDVGTGRNF